MPLPSPPRLRTLCALALAFCLSSAASAQTAAEIDRLAVPEEVAAYVMQPDIAAALNLRVSAEPNGFTPNLIGYNMGVHVPGNNVSGWLRYSEINSARHWWSQKSWPAPPGPLAESRSNPRPLQSAARPTARRSPPGTRRPDPHHRRRPRPAAPGHSRPPFFTLRDDQK